MKFSFNYLQPGFKTYAVLGDSALLPKGLLNQSSSQSIALWMQTTHSGTLLGMQDKKFPEKSGNSSASLIYVGLDGRLHGKFWNGSPTPITSDQRVNDGKWHHVALIGDTSGQSLYLDGQLIRTLKGRIDIKKMDFGKQWSLSNGMGRPTTGKNSYF